VDNDDAPIGRLLSRREALVVLGGGAGAALIAAACGSDDKASPTATTGSSPTGAAATAGADATPAATLAAMPSCIVRPALTEGPYFVDERLHRADIRANTSDGAVRDGVPLALTFNVSEAGANACTPLAGAQVDIWHCDALGVYSDVSDPNFNTKGQDFLRGYQVTDADGRAQFTTIYPGWYQGRAVHIHFKIRNADAAGRHYEFTSQVFFEDALSQQVYASNAPYSEKGTAFLRNAQDGIYQQSQGQLVLVAQPSGNGYSAAFDIGLQLTS
jgi:protocatechuate 3,4-dioxygenase beta subunit